MGGEDRAPRQNSLKLPFQSQEDSEDVRWTQMRRAK